MFPNLNQNIEEKKNQEVQKAVRSSYLLLGAADVLQVSDERRPALVQRTLQLFEGAVDLRHCLVLPVVQLTGNFAHQLDCYCELWESVDVAQGHMIRKSMYD